MIPTRSSSTIKDKKSGTSVDSNSLYEWCESAKVYLIAATTVARAAGSSSWMRA